MKRILCGALSALLIFTGIQLPVRAETAGTEETAAVQPEETAATEPVESVPEETQAPETIGPDANERAPQAMTVSDSGIAMLEELEGRSVSSFRTALTQVENSVNSFLSANGLTLTQQQFDALASLQFNCSAVLSGCRVTRLLTGGDYTEVSMANAWCSWVSVGGSYSSKMLERRIRELQVYFYGDYTGNESDPGFRYLVHMPNGGSLEDNRVLCYPRGETYAALQTATRSGMYFAGWYTAASGGAHITNSTPAAENLIVYAHWSSTPVENPNEDNGGSGEDPVTLKTSEACIQFIKDHEGFSKFAYWDYGQWTIGYGTRCEKNEFPDGITEEEADQRLRLMLVDFEKMVDDVLDASPLVHTQSQYDAMISFTFNLGPQWINPKYNIYQYFVYGGYTEMEFVNTMGRWLSSSSEVVDGLARRRIDEADMYLNGVYRLGSTAYVRVVFNAMGGEAGFNEDMSPACAYVGPEIAGVGYTEERAKELGIEYIVGRFPTSANGRSLVSGCTGGLIKVLAGPKFGEILGVHILAPSATELIEEAALAIRLEATLDELTDTIHCHPTVAEALREAALAAQKRAIHIPNKK